METFTLFQFVSKQKFASKQAITRSSLIAKASECSGHTTDGKASHRFFARKGLLKALCSVAMFVCVPLVSLSPAFAGILGIGEVLERGDRGPQVGAVQRQLRELGLYDGPISEVYGALTEAAVANYQRSINLIPDGIFGAQTDRALFDQGLVGNTVFTTAQATPTQIPVTFALGSRMLQLGDQGQDVRELQALLSNRFAPLRVDGVFGSDTQQMVTNFQRQYNLVADGKVGPATLNTLNALSGTSITAASSTPSVTQFPAGTTFPSVPVVSNFPGTSTPFFSTADAGRSPQATAATLRAAQINQGPYTVVIPADSDDLEKLNWVKRTQPQACMARSRRGSYIFAGGYPEYSNAETVRLMLRANRPDVNTSRTNARVDYRGGDFTVECLY